VLRWPGEPENADSHVAVDAVRSPIDPSVFLVVGAGTTMLGYLIALWGLGLAAGFLWTPRPARGSERPAQDELIARVGVQTAGLALLGLGLALLATGVCSGGVLFFLLERLSR
jgi:hypothetical protein